MRARAVTDDQLVAAVAKAGYEAAPILPDAASTVSAPPAFDRELAAVLASAPCSPCRCSRRCSASR